MLMSALFVAAENDTQFDPTTASPGTAGFIFSGLLAAAVIVLGFLLVSRLRRNAYRHEVREQIADELAAEQAGDDAAAGGGPSVAGGPSAENGVAAGGGPGDDAEPPAEPEQR